MRCWLLLGVLLLGLAGPARAQTAYDASWYDPDRPHVKIAVTEDGIYRVTGADLQAAGVALERVRAEELRVIENGREIPIHVSGAGPFGAGDAFTFVGRRNRGTGERWAYEDNDASLQSSTFRSLFTDTTTYWLTWGGPPGRRYETARGDAPAAPPENTVAVVRDTLHLEKDERYYYGDTQLEIGRPLYTRGEGYYWDRLAPGGAPPDRRTYVLEMPRLAASSGQDVRLAVRLNGASGARHHVALEVAAGGAFEPVDEATWRWRAFRTLRAAVPAPAVTDGTLRVHLTATRSAGEDAPDQVLLDWIEAAYPRRLAPAEGGQQRFTASAGAARAFRLEGYAGAEDVHVLRPDAGRRFVAPTGAGGRAAFTDASGAAAPGGEATYWAAAPETFRTPAAITRDAPSRWAAAPTAADYVILTTDALRASAEQLAALREAQNGFAVAVVRLRDVYDEFGYGRATPLAIRRFVHRTQQWATPPRFLALWGDAAFPVRTETDETGAPWNVPAFGYAPSDSWYAMQYDGPDDWTEVLALGRLPIRSNAEGQLLVQKMRRYEQAPVEAWQKRMLLLSGGTTPSEQRLLQNHTATWGAAAGTRPTGMDTLYFAKQSDDVLDTSFQDSLSAAFARGASWLNYFGHSAAQTWEIVTEAPAEFGNAGRLPFVVSLGCQTGAFAGGRFSEKTRPSFGEKLLLGYGDDNQPSMSGAIAHFGTSYLGSISVSAALNDALVERVFEDTMRVMGPAIRQAKAALARRYGDTPVYRDHLMQYQLLGDPALTLALARKPDYHLDASQLRLTPAAPTASDSLRLAVRVTNHGLVPTDTARLGVLWRAPGGRQRTFTDAVPPFRLEHVSRFGALLTDADVGVNQFRAAVDPENHIDEAVETNNAAERQQTVFAAGVAIVSPREQGLAPSRRPTLRFTVAGSTPPDAAVRLQLYEDPAFEHVVAQTERRADRLAIDWQPQSTLEAGQTYHWRARVEDGGGAGPTAWQHGAFTVRSDLAQRGWMQQGALFEASATEQLAYADGWQLGTYELSVLATSERGAGAYKGQFNVDGAQVYERLGLGFGVLHVDGQTGAVRASASLCTYPVARDDFRAEGCTDGLDGPAAVDLLQNTIEQMDDGDYLFVRTRHLARGGASQIPDEVRQIFRTLGSGSSSTYSAAIDTLTYGDLWIMQARKGHPQETVEHVAPAGNGENEITYRAPLAFRHAAGHVTTPRIGPARTWEALAWTADLDGADVLRIDVLDGTGEVLLEGVGPSPRALEEIDARRHPYLRLRATLADSARRTAPQLRRWRLTYAPTAELAADGRRLTLSGDSLAEREPLEVAFPVANIGHGAAERVHVEYTVTDAGNRTRTVAVDTLGALAPGAEATTRATVATDELGGANTLAAHVRAARPEYLSFNNTVVRTFTVGADEKPPEVRVLVDGRPLPPDPEPLVNLQDPSLPFVSARPTIEIEIEDADAAAPIARPELVEVYLDCDPTDPTRSCPSVPAADTTFHPAGSPGEAARVFYEPDLAARDTTHTLRVVVRDAAGNVAGGRISYQAHLRVQSELAVRDLYPFPNPMSAHTTFAFQLKGADAAQVTELRVRIYTLTGRLIREFDVIRNPMLLTGGALTIGWNKIRWNGTDADGDRVATGVYLYKVFMDTTEGEINVNGGGVEKIAVIR